MLLRVQQRNFVSQERVVVRLYIASEVTESCVFGFGKQRCLLRSKSRTLSHIRVANSLPQSMYKIWINNR